MWRTVPETQLAVKDFANIVWLIFFLAGETTGILKCRTTFFLHIACQNSSGDIIWVRNVRFVVSDMFSSERNYNCMLTAIRITCVNEWKGFCYSLSVSITILQDFARSFHCYFVLYTYQAVVLTVHLVSTLIPSPRGNPFPVVSSGRKGVLSLAPLNRDRLHTSCIIFLCLFFFVSPWGGLMLVSSTQEKEFLLVSPCWLFLIDETNNLIKIWSSLLPMVTVNAV